MPRLKQNYSMNDVSETFLTFCGPRQGLLTWPSSFLFFSSFLFIFFLFFIFCVPLFSPGVPSAADRPGFLDIVMVAQLDL